MKNLFKIFRFKNSQAGMTYVELIVVLTIFAIMSAVIMFNYGEFQSKIEMRSLASDVALKFVQAQKSALAGRIPPVPLDPGIEFWKPSYGVFLDLSQSDQAFIFFTDIDQNKSIELADISPDYTGCIGGECLDFIKITRGNFVSAIYEVDPSGDENLVDGPISISYTRPASVATFTCSGCDDATNGIKIQISSPDGVGPSVFIYGSGRIQIN